MDIVCVGGGPGGLYFAVLMKKANPDHRIRVIERNRPEDTFGFGVVFSEATMSNIAQADAEAYNAIAQHLVFWNDIEVHRNGDILISTGHGFSGMSRRTLLEALQKQARELGVTVDYEREVTSLDGLPDADLIVASDGVHSTVRHLLEPAITTTIDLRPNRFVWLGTTKPLPAFTFFFRSTPHGLWRVHAYQYQSGRSTFIVECREETWRAAGMDRASEDETAAFLEGVFAEDLDGHRLITNRSLWRQFPTVRTEPWRHGNVVLIGDAAHTAHFSVGSGTRMAMEDAVALRDALEGGDLGAALAAYESSRRPPVESLQRAAQASLQWFEDTERYMSLDLVPFSFSLLTRSLRIGHEDLRARDPAFVAQVDRAVAARAAAQTGGSPVPAEADPAATPFRLRDLIIPNRLVVSSGQDVAEDGDAMGAVGLVMAEMSGVSSPVEWTRVVDVVRGRSAAKVGAHVSDAGAVHLALDSGFDLVELDYEGWEIVEACRRAWPPHLPLSVRIQVGPWAPHRLDADEAVAAARALKDLGCDLVHVAAGGVAPRDMPRDRVFLTPFAERIRHEAGMATMVGGDIKSYKDVNTIVAAGRADLCVLATRDSGSIHRRKELPSWAKTSGPEHLKEEKR